MQHPPENAKGHTPSVFCNALHTRIPYFKLRRVVSVRALSASGSCAYTRLTPTPAVYNLRFSLKLENFKIDLRKLICSRTGLDFSAGILLVP